MRASNFCHRVEELPKTLWKDRLTLQNTKALRTVKMRAGLSRDPPGGAALEGVKLLLVGFAG